MNLKSVCITLPPWEDEYQLSRKHQSPNQAKKNFPNAKKSHQSERREAVKYVTMLSNLKRKHSSHCMKDSDSAVDTLTLICLKTLASHFRMIEISMSTAELREIFVCIPTNHLELLMSLLIERDLLRERSFSFFCRPDLHTVTAVGLRRFKTSVWEMCMPRYITSRDGILTDAVSRIEGWMNVVHLNVSYSNIPLNILSTIISHSNGLKELVMSGWRATGNSSKSRGENDDDDEDEDGNLREYSFSVLSIEKTREMDGVSYINVDDCPWFDDLCLAELVRGRKLHSLRLLSCRGTRVTLSSEQASNILRQNGGVAVVHVRTNNT
jgi:hypothetical protein